MGFGRELILDDLLGSAGSADGSTAALRGMVVVGGQVGCIDATTNGGISLPTQTTGTYSSQVRKYTAFFLIPSQESTARVMPTIEYVP